MDMMTVQQNVAAAVAADNPYAEWERIVVDVEIAEQDTGYEVETISFAVVRNADKSLSMADIDLSSATREAVVSLYRERLDNAGDKIGSFGLEIDHDGKYRFEISYDRPKRINGEWDEAKAQRLDNYLATYKR